MDPASTVLAEGLDPSKPRTYAALSESSNVPTSTLWHRAHGRPSRQEKAEYRQYLTPAEEKALVEYVLRMAKNGFPIPIKFLRSLARDACAAQRAVLAPCQLGKLARLAVHVGVKELVVVGIARCVLGV